MNTRPSPAGPHTSGRAGIIVLALATVVLAAIAWRAMPRGAEAAGEILTGRQINVNRATRDELSLLPSIGPALADRIIEDRVARGPFVSLDDLGRVRGVGPATIAAIAPHATAGVGAER
ncbi:MAG: helix-hairpin-helix domain-containing protein [Phycisphaerae bacterium]|nr:helix-hairpin-helix domain-containing protein [Phycisphaerae bacterium]